MIVALLMACQVIDPLQERAENAALVCYDNGTLVYASETTIDEMDILLREWRSCEEAKEKRASEYRKVLSEHCPWETYRKEQSGESRAVRRAAAQAASARQKECMGARGYGDPSSDTQCGRFGPEPRKYTQGWVFEDKGVDFNGANLKCVSRIPVETTTTKEK